MLLCPLDYRYGRDDIKSIFAEESRLLALLKVEVSLAKAHAEVGNIPREAASEIARKANLEHIKIERVKEIEDETKHDIMAVVRALTEQCGDAGRFVHLGATSNDIIDTATAIQLGEALKIISRDIDELIISLATVAKKHRGTVMVGRTHGQYAIPITFGFKVAGYLAEMIRYRERINEVSARILVGKMSGAVGTGAALGEHFFRIQELVMKDLGIGVEEVATQIVGRDRYTELITLMASICTSCERYATEVRNLQRSEIQEVCEAFDAEKQVGSSTMAHKKNPVISENVCGLTRIVRSFVTPTYENMILWHERDLTNSSAERFIIPHVIVLTDDILAKTRKMLSFLAVNKDRMLSNLAMAKGKIMAEAVMIALVEKGMGRQVAHEIVRRASMEADEKDVHLMETLRNNDEVISLISDDELEKVMDPKNYVGKSPEIVDRTVAKAELLLGIKI
ncbi:MAG: adenylosuccinate lyase [Methanomassiliicoccales archaeon]|nr:adenylosuccinate lyase [Methanomassiliicoccales archaeon]NYT15724.1 adenylosuccinate lyase [Methanomassiliicoccales archaeon]